MIGFILNFPYTLIGVIISLVSIPTGTKFNKQPIALVIGVKKFWWAVGYLKNARAMAIGHVVLLSPKTEVNDLEHELVHVQQNQRMLLIQPFLYWIELIRKGYKNNKYEIEAYQLVGDKYYEK